MIGTLALFKPMHLCGFFNISSSMQLMALASGTGIDTDAVSNTSKMIAEYGFMTVCCGVLIVFSILMFKNLMSSKSTVDGSIKKIENSLDVIQKSIAGTTNVAEVFDKHNTKSTLEFDHVKRDLEDVKESTEELKEKIDKIQRAVDKQISQIDNLTQIANRMAYSNGGNKNTMSRQ